MHSSRRLVVCARTRVHASHPTVNTTLSHTAVSSLCLCCGQHLRLVCECMPQHDLVLCAIGMLPSLLSTSCCSCCSLCRYRRNDECLPRQDGGKEALKACTSHWAPAAHGLLVCASQEIIVVLAAAYHFMCSCTPAQYVCITNVMLNQE
jgi:hypothetical protein